jgi:hypothetical protein
MSDVKRSGQPRPLAVHDRTSSRSCCAARRSTKSIRSRLSRSMLVKGFKRAGTHYLAHPCQRIHLQFHLLSKLYVAQFLAFFQFFGQLAEHLARIAQTADMDPRLFEILVTARQAGFGPAGFVIAPLARFSSRQIEHVKFDPG